MGKLKSIKICDCCNHPITLSGGDLDVCNNCGVEYQTDETGTYIDIWKLMDSIERIEDEL